jgi:ATP-dependent DNA helicase RecQ
VNHLPLEILRKYWGHQAFRPLQEEIIGSVLAGHDTLALLPTGGGKSICFQVPALCMEGLCLVVSPLIALMKDQVDSLERKGIPALHIFTGMHYREIEEVMRKAMSGKYRFLYCSPERLQSPLFREYLPGLPLSFIAVDEAHCISQWGYDFRPSYLQIATLRAQRRDVPMLALTASATPDVRADIMKRLEFRNGGLFAGSFARANLSYHVVDTDSRIHRCVDIVKKMKGTGLVYCRSRKRTAEIANLLKLEQVSAECYHAGLPQEQRNERQNGWLAGSTRVIVCTNAFGMGIDKPDVRFVVHLDCPESLENYYQEAGRAGRDGKRAYAVLLRTPSTVKELEELPDIRFPSMATVRKVYQALGDHLQVASGTGEDASFDFDLNEFARRFKLNVFEAMYSIEAMEQEGILQLSEQVFIPSRLQFIMSRSELEYIEQQNPELEPLSKALLRTYSGIWDQPTSISEKQLCRVMKTSLDKVLTGLRELQRLGMVVYEPRRENPQVRLLQNRVKADDLYINPDRYLARKKAHTERVRAMSGYLTDTGTCRTRKICAYFGDQEPGDCGICDHCMRAEKEHAEPRAMGELIRLVTQKIGEGHDRPDSLRRALPHANAAAVERVMQFLEAEGLMEWEAEGRMVLKKKGPG